MNIHHLELFYHVVKNEGITAAARNMPYGIQQAAISGQVAQLEEFLGVVLFHRRPFALTVPGQKLFNFIKPFFDNLESIAEEVRGGVAQQLRIAASEIVLQDYLPDMIQQTRQQFPKLKVTLREAYYPEFVKWLEQREVDLCLGLIGGKVPTGIHTLPLFDLPLVLLVPQDSKIRSAAELWEQDHIEEKLITTPSNQVICRAFQEGLAKRKVDWFSGIEVSTVALVETYVAKGYGIGVTVGVHGRKYHPQVRVVPLDDFPKTTFGALWQGFHTPVLDHFLKVVEQAARREMAISAPTPQPPPNPKPAKPPLSKPASTSRAGGSGRAG
jgi:DNA-binding transcriptional LysR family regulator